jgi:hypothetical protein
MSGHLRFGFAACLVAAGVSTPAVANVITDFFSPRPAPEAAAAAPAPAPAPEECLRQPGPAAAGQHWVYRFDGHRKCWFQAAEDSALAKKPARRHVARRSVAAVEENEPAPRRQKAVEDARDELVNPAPAETPQPAPSAPKLTVVRTIPVRTADAAALVPPAPVPAGPGVDQPTSGQPSSGQPSSGQPSSDQPSSDQPMPRQVDVEKLLADAPAASDEVAAAPPATPVAAPTANTRGGEAGTASWVGVLLIALGGVALLGSSATLGRALWSVRCSDSGTELAVVAYDGRNDPFFLSEHIPSAGAGRDELLRYDPQSVAPLAHADRTRRTRAPDAPAREASWEEGIGALAALASRVPPEVFSGRRATAYRGVEQRGSVSGS